MIDSKSYVFGFNEKDMLQATGAFGRAKLEYTNMTVSGFTNIRTSTNYIKGQDKSGKTTLTINYTVSGKDKKGKTISKSFTAVQFIKEDDTYVRTSNTNTNGQ